ncbi:MAG: hypothetical protein DI609_12955 [Corynebacterium urealyticum]|uniref:Secreted protein n=1 Tax=Corynebacterium urealyticum TaxID=43771 RepID=A0A2W5AW41_9CORY|nr:MAG: hypothetical protein DI609_12955 [Corynebacterium urealyticum]
MTAPSVPFGKARRNRYVAAVGAATVLGLAGPVAVNAALTAKAPAHYANPAEAFDENLMSFADWPLDFGVLRDCAAPITEDAMVAPEFSCPSSQVEVVSMLAVQDQALAVDRAIRAINFADLQSMRPVRYTETALEIAPELKERTGVTDVWVTDYYEVAAANDEGEDVDPFSDADLSRTVGFFREDDGGDGEGTLVSLQVTARGVDSTKAMVNELLKTAELRPEAATEVSPQQREGGR